jgi:endonuclease/exonuclease/phosphatase family metal-dependent hydrolase
MKKGGTEKTGEKAPRKRCAKLRLRVFSYNIHKGFSGGNLKYTLALMREEIRKLHPDLLFLQEVHGEHAGHRNRIKNWPAGSQFEYLAEELWPHFSYGKNVVYGNGHHGNAILSKFPIERWENINVSQNRFEQRGILHAQLRIPGHARPLHAFCVHLGLRETDRTKQLAEIVKRIESSVGSREPLIAAGDFNDWRSKANDHLVKRSGPELEEAFQTLYGHHARTFPSWLPTMRLDRVYYRGFKIHTAVCLRHPPWNSLSDHTPLEVVLDLQDAG